MKKLLSFIIICLMFSCGKNTSDENISGSGRESLVPPYDTIAKDSFSAGAVSVDVARRIRMSSQKYQDSLKEIRIKAEEEKMANKLKEEKEKLDKKAEDDKKAEADRKKAEEEQKLKKEKEKQKAEVQVNENAAGQ